MFGLRATGVANGLYPDITEKGIAPQSFAPRFNIELLSPRMPQIAFHASESHRAMDDTARLAACVSEGVAKFYPARVALGRRTSQEDCRVPQA